MKISSAGLKNAVKITVVGLLYILFVTTVGFLLAKPLTWVFAAVSSAIFLLDYLFSERMILLMRRACITDNDKLISVVEETANGFQFPVPKIYFVSESPARVFSVGKSICLTSTLLDLVNKQELQALILREMIKIKDLDTNLRDTIVFLTGPASSIFLAITVSPVLETDTDFEAAKITGDPDSLTSALGKTLSTQEGAERVKLLRNV